MTKIDHYYAVCCVASPARPNVDDSYVLYWPEANIRIPWPKGMTPKEAIVSWATAHIVEFVE